MFKIPMRFKKQAGYILLEGALGLSLAAGVMTYYMAEEKNRFAEDMAKIHGQHMKAMSAATNAYITNNYGRLIAGTPIPIPGSTVNVANPLAPTVQELMALGLLPNSPGLANPVYGGGFTIRLTTNPVAGAVNGFVGTTASVAPGGQVSSRTIGRALQEIGINGMATGLGGMPDNELRAQNQDRAVAGPNVNVAFAGAVTPQPGLMAVQVGTGVCNDGTGLACDVFLRRDGTRPMTGDLDMGVSGAKNNIFLVNNIGTGAERAGTVFSTDLDADQNIISRNGNIRADGTGPNGNITANNNITATNGNITATTGNIEATAGNVRAGQNVQAGQDVIANNNITATTGNITATAGDVTAGRNVIANENITATTGNITATAGDVTAGRDLIALRNLGTPGTPVQKIYAIDIGTPDKRVQNIFAKNLDLEGDLVAENITARNLLKTKDLEVTGEVTNTLNMGNGANLNMGENDIKNVKDIGEDSVLGRVKNIFTNILNAVTAYIQDLYVYGKVMTNLVMDNTDITDANLVATKTLTASTAVDTNNLKVTGQVLAALNMGGNDITNAKDIGATGNISTTGNISATSPTSTVYTTDLSVTGNVITDLKLGSNANNEMNNSIRNVQTVYAKYFHTEGTAGCDTSLDPDKNCGGSIKTAHLKSVGNVDVHKNLYLGPPGSTQMRLGDIPGGTAYWTSSCPANTVMVGVHGCSFSGSGSGGGTAPEGGGYVPVSVGVSGSATCYAVCAPIAPARVNDF